MKIELLPKLYFSYSQFLVYDANVQFPGCLWNDVHVAQGFARRPSVVCFSTLLEFGDASVCWTHGPFEPSQAYQRVIAVPFAVVSGKVIVDGPDERGRSRFFQIPAGDYEIIGAQLTTGDDQEAIDLFVQRYAQPVLKSRILVADAALNPPPVLVETAGTA